MATDEPLWPQVISASTTFSFTKTIRGDSAGTYTIADTATVTGDTGQLGSASDSVTVTVQECGYTICGTKFYDTDADGTRDGDEPGIAGWKILLSGTDEYGGPVEEYTFTDDDGNFMFENVLAGTYTVAEVFPISPPMWVNTTDTSATVTLPSDDPIDCILFGNVCLSNGHGGVTLGFWSNKNGQALIAVNDIAALNADLNLWKPAGWAYPPFIETNLTIAKAQIKNYLLSATAVDMRWMLSAQLIAAKLSVRQGPPGFLSGSTIVQIGPMCFLTINDILAEANAALLLDPAVDDSARGQQAYWKNILEQQQAAVRLLGTLCHSVPGRDVRRWRRVDTVAGLG